MALERTIFFTWLIPPCLAGVWIWRWEGFYLSGASSQEIGKSGEQTSIAGYILCMIHHHLLGGCMKACYTRCAIPLIP
ncbi:hypothetical protein F4824DRAFT_97974 [Ustulina deusta]|nr:hypothetical protein F4824DRAFT_97974 [Ustulina deusta]